ncbi:MAG: hypothetical protein ACD_36C00174G0006 [uncultured bacterium]|uniref:RNA-binding protein KhpA n=1 Tax=Candidatus Gottesmanbacteria bacterium RIFCSPLOWO2_01_FULL_43_11b TaxID=1798392 RepID=A0A1F6AG28_9BACT|nr:MAG: hypothetical protein ACD_36C00174G0006 [uncultured bacterium]OGG23674.1 MAG: hypothetical protein A3A79_00500 [Candidatus Gottesmanbacteria bacterium RIFCSPLOWO2_01_FULL_43_11b]
MKDTLLYLVTALVDNPKDVEVTESNENDRVLLSLSVNPADMGKIIGKSGRIIKALRDLMKVLAAKRNQYVDIVLSEEAK